MSSKETEYGLHEGALLRSGPDSQALVDVYFPGQGWSPTGEVKDWMARKPISSEKAQQEMERQDALYGR
jgi:hypothetical protein